MSVYSAWQWVLYITNVILYHSLTLYHSRTDKLSKMLVPTAFVKKNFLQKISTVFQAAVTEKLCCLFLQQSLTMVLAAGLSYYQAHWFW